MKMKLCSVIAGLVLVASSLNAAAGAYGALATSPKGDHGYSKNYDKEEEAINRALLECRKYSKQCAIKKVFKDACMSVVSSSNGAMGWTWGYARDEGNRRAMDECRSNKGRGCRLVQRFCTGDADDD